MFGRPVEKSEPPKQWLAILQSGSRLERIKAIQGLAAAGEASPEIIAALERCLEDPSVSIRHHAKKALKTLREE